jgi:hypothetical protein
MTTTPINAEAILDDIKAKRGRPVKYTDEQRAARALAKNRAVMDARTALVSIHKDEYDLLYAVAQKRRLKEAGFDE